MKLQIEIKSIQVAENGKKEAGNGNLNTLKATLVYPRSGEGNISTIKTFILKDMKKYEIDPKDIEKKILFKEEIWGDTLLILELYAQLEKSKLKELINKSISENIGNLLDYVPDIGFNISSIKNVISNRLFSEKDDNILLGEARYLICDDLKSGNLPVISLENGKDIELFINQPNREPNKYTVEKGTVTAQIELAAKIFE